MEYVYLTDEEFKALPTVSGETPPALGIAPWKVDHNGDGYKTTTGAAWYLCRWEEDGDGGWRVSAAPIAIVSISERVRRAVEADRKARETVALDVAQQTALCEMAPFLMGELMEGFIKRKSLNERAQTRQRMKALLDLMSADTEYPEVPALNPDQDTIPRGRRRAGPGYVGVEPPPGVAVGGGIQYQPARPDGGADELRRAIEHEVRRELGGAEARRVLPAPGAPAAAENEAILADEG